MSRPQRLNIRAFKKGDIVQHYRSGRVYRISGPRWWSECYNMLDLVTGKQLIAHPRFYDLSTNPLIVLAAAAIE